MKRELRQIQIPFLKEPGVLATYENGYSLVFVPKRGGVFNISTWVKTGSVNEDDAINGISHFLEHLLFKGTERFGPGEFDKKMESMGAIINAATWKDFTFYYVTGPRGDQNKNFETALDMHADMMLFSTLPDAEIGPQYNPDDPDYTGEKRERSVVIEEIGMREDQPWTKVYNSVNHMMYPEGHPYQRDVIGTRQIIGNVPRESIVGYYRSWYSPDRFTTIIVGDFDWETLEPQVLKCFDFSKLPPQPGTITGGQTQAKGGGNGKNYQEVPGEYQTNFFILGFHGPDPKHLEETIAMDVVSYVLGEARSSRLTQALLEKPKTPVFNMVATGQSTYKLGNAFYIQGNFAADKPDAPLKDLHAVVENFLEKSPITEEEFSRAVKKLKVDFAETSETASGIAEAIGESLTVIGDIGTYTEYLETLSKLDLKTVRQTAKKYLQLDKAYTSILVQS